MSEWGVVIADDGLKHIVPVDSAGHMYMGHALTEICCCKPRRDDQEPTVIIHNDPERGGYNS